MIALDGVKAGALLFVAAVIQVSVLNSVTVLGGTPDFLLVTLCAVALLRGSIFGAVGGFFAGLVVDTATLDTMGVTALLLTLAGYWIGRYGETNGRGRQYAPVLSVGVVTILYAVAALLVVDTATLDTMGVTALLLTLAGYWIGRYGETTGRGRQYAPVVSVGVVTILYAVAALLVRFMLGEGGSPEAVLLDALPPSLLFNLLIALPVYWFCRWVLSLGHERHPVREVRLIE